MPPQAATATKESTRFSHRVLAVFPRRSNQPTGGEDTLLRSDSMHQWLFLDASCDPTSSVLFRFSLSISQDVTLYLQLLPDRITSLIRATHDDVDRHPEFNSIQREFGGARRLLSLHFRLCKAGDLIAPTGFDIDHSDTETTYHLESMKSLASSSEFSVYMGLHDLTKAKFAIFQKAISQPLSDSQIYKLKWRADPSRLYRGKGGVVVTLREDADSSQRSCASTVAYDSPPGYSFQPDDTKSTLPTYQQANGNVVTPAQVLGKRRRSGSESDGLPAPKRTDSLVLSPSHVVVAGSCGTSGTLDNDSHILTLELSHNNLQHVLRTLMTTNEQLEARLARQQLDIQGLMEKNEQLEAQVSRHQLEMQSLLDAVKKLQDQKDHLICFDQLAERQEELERRQEECEDGQAMLERRQETTEETVEAIEVRVTELDGLLEDDWKHQLCDEIKDEAAAGIRECLRHI